MGLQSRVTVFAAIGGLLALMGFFVFYASLDNPELEKAEIKLHSIEILDVNTVENKARMEVTFLVKNPSEKTFTIANISYELFANGKSIGSSQYSTEDISMPGRAAFYPGAEIPLKSILILILTEDITNEYNAIVAEDTIKINAEGMMVVETAWSLIEKDFKTSL